MLQVLVIAAAMYALPPGAKVWLDRLPVPIGQLRIKIEEEVMTVDAEPEEVTVWVTDAAGTPVTGVELVVTNYDPKVIIPVWKNGIAITDVKGEATLLVSGIDAGECDLSVDVAQEQSR